MHLSRPPQKKWAKKTPVSPISGCARIPQSGGGRCPDARPATRPARFGGWSGRPSGPIRGLVRPDFRRGRPPGRTCGPDRGPDRMSGPRAEGRPFGPDPQKTVRTAVRPAKNGPDPQKTVRTLWPSHLGQVGRTTLGRWSGPISRWSGRVAGPICGAVRPDWGGGPARFGGWSGRVAGGPATHQIGLSPPLTGHRFLEGYLTVRR